MKLHNGCAVLGVVATNMLQDVGVPARVLRVRWSKKECHVVTIFEHTGRLRFYDSNGTKDLPKRLTIDSPPSKIAKACYPASIGGSWY